MTLSIARHARRFTVFILLVVSQAASGVSADFRGRDIDKPAGQALRRPLADHSLRR